MSPVSFIDRPDSLAQTAYKSLRQAIRDSDLEPGVLYSENEVASSMGISRTPVREALIDLSREGLVEIVPQRGFRLRVLDREEEKEVFALRAVLEPFVAERLATAAREDDVGELQEVLERQRSCVDDAEAFLANDEEFHLLMPRLVDLERTHQMLVTLRGALWLMGARALELPARAPGALAEHEAVLEAILDGDAAAAAQAARDHVMNTARALDRTRESAISES
jgi:GntR family transcriptional regulator, rspAB operon transcriptional repressor